MMRRTGFKSKIQARPRNDRSDEFASFQARPRPMAVAMQADARACVPVPKEPKPLRDDGYRRLVASLPCALCGIHGSSQCAHPNADKAKGRKACDLLTFPLCHAGANGCHSAWDSYQVGGRHVQAFREVEFATQTQAALIDLARLDSKARAVLMRVGLIDHAPQQ